MDDLNAKRNTYTVWSFVALFLVLGALGLAMIFMVGNPKGASSQIKVPQTIRSPDPSRDGAGSGAAGAGSGSDSSAVDGSDADGTDADASAANGVGGDAAGSGSTGSGGSAASAVTVPGGAPAPSGVREVLVAQDTTSYSLDIPQEVAAEPLTTKIAPATATADGSELTVRVGCATSVDEVLAQLSVSESESTVSVAAVVLVPASGRPCSPSAEQRTLTVPLARPIGSRSMFVVPPGTPVPTVRAG